MIPMQQRRPMEPAAFATRPASRAAEPTTPPLLYALRGEKEICKSSTLAAYGALDSNMTLHTCSKQVSPSELSSNSQTSSRAISLRSVWLELLQLGWATVQSCCNKVDRCIEVFHLQHKVCATKTFTYSTLGGSCHTKAKVDIWAYRACVPRVDT